MIIICGKTIAEVERDLEMAKQAIASGMPYGVGGETLADMAQAMRGLKQMVGGAVAPITNPNYVAPAEVEDEDEIYCPYCGEPYDGEYCENCGYDPNEDYEDDCKDCEDCDCECGHSCCREYKDEELSSEMIDHITNQYGLPSAWGEIMKKMLGL